MTWPTGSVALTNTDASTDSPADARANLLDALQKLNTILSNGEAVWISGNQTIGGIKTFSSAPVVPVGSASGNAVNKGQMDSAISAATPAASTTVSGLSELATSSETQAGTDAVRSVTPAGLASAMLAGVGQSYVDMSASRGVDTTYTNSTGRPIIVCYSGYTANGAGAYPYIEAVVGGVALFRTTMGDYNGSNYAGIFGSVMFVVPNGATYAVTAANQTPTMLKWMELR